MRWSSVLRKCNVHGRQESLIGPEGQECKMDRSLGKGSVSLSLLWLELGGDTSYEGHMLLKEELSSKDSFARRNAFRGSLHEKAAQHADLANILSLETETRSGVTAEPESIECPAYSRRIFSDTNTDA